MSSDSEVQSRYGRVPELWTRYLGPLVHDYPVHDMSELLGPK